MESFDGFDPDDLEGSLDRLAEFNRNSAKQYSGIYRDLVVRKRKTEIDEMLRDINGPIFDKVAEIIHDIEEGRRVNERAQPRRARRLRRRPHRRLTRPPLESSPMRAAVYQAAGTVTVEDVPDAALVEPTDAVVRVVRRLHLRLRPLVLPRA